MSARKTVVRSRVRRASQRKVVEIDLAAKRLRDLMTEQCKDGSSYLTVYRGSREDLTAAGVPAEALPTESEAIEFQVQTLNVCSTGSYELLKGSTRVDQNDFELEIDWTNVRPYVQAAHPAVGELARMLLKDMMAWTETIPWSERPDLAQPIDMVAGDPRAVDYKPGAGAPRLQVTADFHKKLNGFASMIFEYVHSHCEVMPVPASPFSSKRPRPVLRVVGIGRASKPTSA